MDILFLVGNIILLCSISTELATIEAFKNTRPSVIERIQKRSISRRKGVEEFIEDKLVEQSQALEYILKIVQKNTEMTEKLIKNVYKGTEQPNLPEKVEVHYNTRRSSDLTDEEPVSSFLRLGETLPRYGKFMKDIVIQTLRSNEDPIPLVDNSPNYDSL